MENKNRIEISDELIARYLAGEANPEEAAALFEWLHLPGNVLYFEEFQRAWNATFPSRNLKPINTKEAWNSVSGQINAGSSISRGDGKRPFRFTLSHRFLKIAASVVIGVYCSIFAFYLFQKQKSIQEVAVITKEQSKTIVLPDSSNIVLNRNSTISYPKDFGEKVREVNFSGEGFFKVTANAERPFIVHTTTAKIKVVGTAFNVALEGDQLEVSVQEGKVWVYTNTDSTYLEAGNSASVDSRMKLISVKNSVDINRWGYATHKFVFQDALLTNVFESFEKAYPYSIEILNKDIKNCKLTASFDNVSATEMLNLIGETLDLTILKNDSTFRIDGKGCPWDQ